MIITFLFNLLCALTSCEYHHEYPSDPLRHSRTMEPPHPVPTIQYPQVRTGLGIVEGYTMYTIRRRPIYAFEGIPYAESTEGKNRFKLPVPKLPWSGVLDTKKPGPRCIQCSIPFFPQASGSEDCLSLNIYTPNLNITKKGSKGTKIQLLPVLVYIHGGAFFFSESSHYGPGYLLDENDVLLVTINYRLGIFGFLTTGDQVLPGNLGFKDQVLGLRWVYENIRGFGGDRTLITLMGLSSGATSVHLHMMSELSRGYFSAAISLSGTAFNPGTLMSPELIQKLNRRLAGWMKCPWRTSRKFINCLQRRNAYILAGRTSLLYDRTPVRLIRLGAVIEKPSSSAFLTAKPDEIYRTGRAARVPWISTRTSHEGNFGYQMLKAFGQEFRLGTAYGKYAPALLQYNYAAPPQNLSIITEKVFQHYLGQKSTEGVVDFSVFGDMSTHREFAYGLHKSLQAHSAIAPTYSYLYAYKGRNSVSGLFRMLDQNDGVVHADDLNSIFNMSRHAPGYHTTDPEYSVVRLICNLFANFAKKRVPIYTTFNGSEYPIWESITNPKKIQLLKIDNTGVGMIDEPDVEHLKFWESLSLTDSRPWIPL